MKTNCANSLYCPRFVGLYDPRNLQIGDDYTFPYLKWYDTLSGAAINFPDGTVIEAALTYPNGILAYKWSTTDATITVTANLVQLLPIPNAATAALKPTKLGGERAHFQLRVTYPGDVARTWLAGRLSFLPNRIPS